MFFFDFLWDLCGDRDWDLDFFPDFLGDLDRDRLDLLGVLEPDGDLRKQTETIYQSTYMIKMDHPLIIYNDPEQSTIKVRNKKAVNFPNLYFAYLIYTHTRFYTFCALHQSVVCLKKTHSWALPLLFLIKIPRSKDWEFAFLTSFTGYWYTPKSKPLLQGKVQNGT